MMRPGFACGSEACANVKLKEHRLHKLVPVTNYRAQGLYASKGRKPARENVSQGSRIYMGSRAARP